MKKTTCDFSALQRVIRHRQSSGREKMVVQSIGESGKTTRKWGTPSTLPRSIGSTWELTSASLITRFHQQQSSSFKLKFIVRYSSINYLNSKCSLKILPVKPIVRINHKWDQAISADFGSTITFKCESEGFPEPILYWERSDGVVIVNDSSKYRIDSHTIDT